MRICTDFDLTLALGSVPGPNGLDNAAPNYRLVALLEANKAKGGTNILSTARGMKRSNGQFGPEVQAQVKQEVEGWLCKQGLDELFDEIHYAKPYADVYIDDRALPIAFADNWAELGWELGDYNQAIGQVLDAYTA